MKSVVVGSALVALVLGCQGTAAFPRPPVAGPPPAATASSPRRSTRVTFTLKNGLKVVLSENHSAPVVAFQAWVRVGSADEPPRLAGVAHVFEHMLFKGTKKRGVGQIAQEVEGSGGEINAWTSYDETVYHLVMASDYFDTGLDILADTLQFSSFDPAELGRELKVVLEEVKQGLDDPDRMASQGLFEAAFDVHPYGRPIIGTPETVSRFKRQDLLDFFAKHYVASNLTLAVVGDFDMARAQVAITRAFEKMPAGTPAPKRRAQPPQTAPRVLAVARDVKETQLLLGFRVPSLHDDDVPALDLLAVVLGQGDSSRLNREVVRNQQLVTGASAYGFSGLDPGLFVLGANFPPGRVDEATRALLDEALRLAREDMSPEELNKSRTILESDRVFDKETVQGYARKLGFFASIAGDVAFEGRYFDRLRSLTPADLRRVAARYFRPESLTVFVQIPEPKADRQKDRGARAQAQLEKIVANATARADRRFESAPVPAASAVDAVTRVVLPGGLRLLVMRDPSVPIVAVRAAWPGGLRYEDPASNGISNLLAALLSRGTKTRSAEDISNAVESMAGSLSGFSGRNSLGLQGEFLSRHFDLGLELIADCLQNATFADDELEKERRVVLDDLRAQEDNIGHVAFQLFHSAMWTRHPYRMDQLGTRSSVGGLTRRKLMNHLRTHYRRDNLTIAVVGDVDPKTVVARVKALFPEGSPVRIEKPQIASEPVRTEPTQTFRFLAKEQAHVVIGYPGTTLYNPDRYALEVLSQILSGQGGRLFVEIREKRALAYRVSAFGLEGIDPGYFALYVATGPERLDEAMTALRAEIQRAVDEDVSRDELERAQRYLVGTHAIGLQRKGAIAAIMALNEAYGQNHRLYRQYGDKIRKITINDVRRVARKYLDPKKEVMAVVKPATAAPTVLDSRRAPTAAAARGPSRNAAP